MTLVLLLPQGISNPQSWGLWNWISNPCVGHGIADFIELSDFVETLTW